MVGCVLVVVGLHMQLACMLAVVVVLVVGIGQPPTLVAVGCIVPVVVEWLPMLHAGLLCPP